MKHKVSNCGEIGLVTDIEALETPDNAWTSMSNIRIKRNYASTFPGSNEITDPTADAHYLISLPTPTAYLLIYPLDTDGDGDADQIHKYAGGDISRAAAYTGTSSDKWNGCVLHGIAVLTNNADAPQFTSGGTCADMIYTGANDWDDTAGGAETYRCKVIRSHKNYLWAIGITDDGTDYPHTVHRSGPADPGAMPSSWDYSSTSDRSIRTPLADSPGICVDGLSLRDSFIIYKEDMVYRADDIGGVLQVDFNPIFKDRGLYAVDCVVDIGGIHVCMGDGRLYTHDGFQATDILEGRNADLLFNSINSTYYENTFLAHNISKNEVWICYPTSTKYCDTALVWNYKTNTWFTRQLPDLLHMATGLVTTSTGTAWDYESSMAWDAESELAWEERTYSPIGDTLLGAGKKILQFDYGNQEDGSNMDCYVQHSGFNLGDEDDWHMISAIYPRMNGGAVEISVGTQPQVDGLITWSCTGTFTPGTDDKVDIRCSGPFHAIRFRSQADVNWELSGYTIHFEKEGQR